MKVRKFLSKIGTKDICSRINDVPMKEMDKTCIYRSSAINMLAVLKWLMEYVEGSKLLKYNEITYADHQVYLVDNNMGESFKEEFSS